MSTPELKMKLKQEKFGEIKWERDIWNAAIEAAANKIESAGNILLAHSVRELKK